MNEMVLQTQKKTLYDFNHALHLQVTQISTEVIVTTQSL